MGNTFLPVYSWLPEATGCCRRLAKLPGVAGRLAHLLSGADRIAKLAAPAYWLLQAVLPSYRMLQAVLPSDLVVQTVVPSYEVFRFSCQATGECRLSCPASGWCRPSCQAGPLILGVLSSLQTFQSTVTECRGGACQPCISKASAKLQLDFCVAVSPFVVTSVARKPPSVLCCGH